MDKSGAKGEFRAYWRPLSAASIGLAFGYTFNNYVMNLMSPHLIAEFGWDRARFALLGLIVILAIICQPIAGRLADRFGERRIAAVGVISAPVLYLFLSNLGSRFEEFAAISAIQVILVGGTTSVVVYTRLIARTFVAARGFALGIAASAPALAGAAAAPLIAWLIAEEGWRAAYLWIAGAVALFGGIALLLMPFDTPAVGTTARGPRQPTDYRRLLRNRAFRLIMAGTLLCNLTITLQMSQINLMLGDAGVGARAAALMLTLYGGGIIAGRLLCGVALDRYPSHIVAAVSMAAPAIGLVILASGTVSLLLLGLAIATLGLSLGAEGDIGAYLVMRHFPAAIYSSVVGLVIGGLAASGAIGTVLLSLTLGATGTFAAFLLLSAVATLVGAGLFLALGSIPSSTGVLHEQ